MIKMGGIVYWGNKYIMNRIVVRKIFSGPFFILDYYNIIVLTVFFVQIVMKN